MSELSGFAAVIGVSPGHVIPSSHGAHGSILIHLNVTFVFSSRPETKKQEISHGGDDDDDDEPCLKSRLIIFC